MEALQQEIDALRLKKKHIPSSKSFQVEVEAVVYNESHVRRYRREVRLNFQNVQCQHKKFLMVIGDNGLPKTCSDCAYSSPRHAMPARAVPQDMQCLRLQFQKVAFALVTTVRVEVVNREGVGRVILDV